MPPTRLTSVLAPAATQACAVRFGAGATALGGPPEIPTLDIALPLLGGPACETLLASAEAMRASEGVHLFETTGRVAGFAVAPPDGELETAARALYARLFAAIGERRLYRIWNYVPQINAEMDGLENYRRFCRGRSLAFEARFGRSFHHALPAGSAVGTPHGPLAVAFLAGDLTPRHVENPQQVPAFEYPADYGPRAPSFSRATLVSGSGTRELYISGTAAIRGHATVAANNLDAQLACTMENLRVVAAAAGAGAEFGARDGWQRTLKVYVRHAGSLPQVRGMLEAQLLRDGDTITYLEADLCRADLRVEVEAVLTRSPERSQG